MTTSFAGTSEVFSKAIGPRTRQGHQRRESINRCREEGGGEKGFVGGVQIVGGAAAGPNQVWRRLVRGRLTGRRPHSFMGRDQWRHSK